MARNWIVIGDPTTGGGFVITASSFTDVDGLPVARVSDKATCPKHKGVFPIVDGDVTMIVGGQPVAVHGSSLACGCKVLSAKQNHVFVEYGGAPAITPASTPPPSAPAPSPADKKPVCEECLQAAAASASALMGR